MDTKDLPSLTLDDIEVDLGNIDAAQSYHIAGSGSIDTITLDPTWATGSITIPSISSITNTGSITYSGSYNNWGTNPATVSINQDGIDMAAGTDIKVDGKSLKEFMSKMEQRMAILVPDPAKLEKFEALKKAYEHYKTMESLCFDEPKEEE